MSQEKIAPSDLTPPPRYYRGGRNLPVAIAVGVALFSAVVLTLAFWHWGFILLVALALSLGESVHDRVHPAAGLHGRPDVGR